MVERKLSHGRRLAPCWGKQLGKWLQKQRVQNGIAGVYGNGSDCKFGVLGTTRGPIGTVGVVGASVTDTNDLNNLNVPSEEVELKVRGDGIGVLGMSQRGLGVLGKSDTGPGVSGRSGTGPGVSGRSVEGVGVLATSEAGVSLHAVSEKNRAGVFQAGQNVAQINLVPLVQGTQEPQLPKHGDICDLLLIRNVVTQEPKADPIAAARYCGRKSRSGLRAHGKCGSVRNHHGGLQRLIPAESRLP